HKPPRNAADLTAAGIALEHQPARLGVLWQQLQLPRRLNRGDIDLFWSPLQTLPLASRVPAVVTVHDLTALLLPETHSARVRWSQLPFLGRSLDRACLIVADSEATAADLRFHFPDTSSRLRVIYPGVDPVFTPAPPEDVKLIRNELGCPDGYLLFVGTLEPRKNIPTLLDAWEALRREDPATPPLVLAGGPGWHGGVLPRRLQALAPHGLHHLGRVSDQRLVRLMQGATIFVYPSLYEGFGLPPLEAMACGVPVVTSDAASLPEVVGNAGLTVEPRNPEALITALERLLANPDLAAELGRRGRERAATFTWERAAAEIEAVFFEALGQAEAGHGIE
ncbi:MAG TPA: glycosyltransferase family 1 protein, partial [Thermoanaerobaculia bacterium]|nr:glycosyltransferase family 1 protein [Thermoanaerobaculia bacterium]